MTRPRRADGFTDMGSITIPPRPPKFALRGRDDGLLYELVKNGAVPSASLLSALDGHLVMGAYEGPYVPVAGGSRRLFVSSGVLSSEPVDGGLAIAYAPVHITVASAPLDVWRVVWDEASGALSLLEVL